jgi:hypothetical protein
MEKSRVTPAVIDASAQELGILLAELKAVLLELLSIIK